MTDTRLPSPELLCKLLRYEPETGKLFWLPRGLSFFKDARSWKKWNTRYAEEEAFTKKTDKGYKTSSLLNKTVYAHRVIWAIQTGAWPENDIDHIDRNPSNNSWINLRQATKSQNKANTKSRKNTTSKYLGVNWYSRDKKWHAQITKNGKNYHLGYFNCEEDAAMSYDKAAIALHGNFANLNFPDATTYF
jgi:hypothetical protein